MSVLGAQLRPVRAAGARGCLSRVLGCCGGPMTSIQTELMDSDPRLQMLTGQASRSSTRDQVRVGFMIAPFALGVIAAQQIRFGGQLYVGELLAVLILLPIVWRWRLTTVERRMFLLALMWAAAQLLSDLYNQTPVLTSLKGVLAPLIFVATILGLGVYYRTNLARMPSFLLGMTVGAVVDVMLSRTAYFVANEWKWGIGVAVLGVFTIHYSFFLRRKRLAWLFAGLSVFLVVSLYFDARSLAFLPLLAGVLYARFRSGRGRGFGGSLAASGACSGCYRWCLWQRLPSMPPRRPCSRRGTSSPRARRRKHRSTRVSLRADTGFSSAGDQRLWCLRRRSWTAPGSVTDRGRSTRVNTRRSSPSFVKILGTLSRLRLRH